MEKISRFKYKVRRSAFAAVVLLILIYVLGIYTTLFIEIPEGGSWGFVMGSGILLAHATLGTLLIFHSATLVAMSAKIKDRIWVTASVIGLAGVLLSVGTGSSFVSQDNDVMSILMALGFAVSMLAYVFGIYASKE